jgi:hypothetical protein
MFSVVMSSFPATFDRRTRAAVQRLFVALDRSVEASREVERARAALERESNRKLRLVGVPDDGGEVDSQTERGARIVR